MEEFCHGGLFVIFEFIEGGGDGETVLISVEGSINNQTAPDFQAAIASALPTAKLIIDLAKVDYVSSAGLRVFMWANRQFAQGAMVVRHLCPEVQEVFSITGFLSILTIE